MEKTVIELFAGVGGFRVGLNEVVSLDENGKAIEKNNFKFVWANQWEPGAAKQNAFDCYQKRFGADEKNSNTDIGKVVKSEIPDHSLLVGGFPCQDYSVARSLSNEKGIEGKKGVLWWQIVEILKAKKPSFILLENVDRLLKSPSKQRGRDFGIMLRCLDELGYGAEWRVINAADYGHPQRRRRIYIFGFLKTTKYYKAFKKASVEEIFLSKGLFAQTFPISDIIGLKSIAIGNDAFADLVDVSKTFKASFENAGFLMNGTVNYAKFAPITIPAKTLGEILQAGDIPDNCFLKNKEEKFAYLKGAKKINREKNGISYVYSEGPIAFPDKLDAPGRTMLTSEATVNRSSHVILDPEKKALRFITPVEAERLNEFPDNWTNTGMPQKQRYFMMGNALVCGVIKKLGTQIGSFIDNEK